MSVLVAVLSTLHNRSVTQDLVGEKLTVCLVLEREEGADDVEGDGCPGRVGGGFLDWVTLQFGVVVVRR